MDDFPPYEFLCQVCRHAVDSVTTYLWLWDNQDQHNQVVVDKDLMSPESLYDIQRLDELNVVDTQEINGEIVVKLKKSEIKANGYLLS